MRIAIFGWGSLIWDPRELQMRGGWHADGPVLPIEFSRVSADGRLTLVIDEENGVPTHVLYAESAFTRRDEARKNLQDRESVPDLEAIGYFDATAGSASGRARTIHPNALECIKQWTKNSGFEATIWTALKPQFEQRTGEKFTPAAALRQLLRTPISVRGHALAYLVNAPLAVETPFRAQFRRWAGLQFSDQHRGGAFARELKRIPRHL